MTALDQAFIKAFAQQSPSSAASSQTAAETPAAPALKSSPKSVAKALKLDIPPSTTKPSRGKLTPTTPRLDGAHPSLPPLSASLGGAWEAIGQASKPPALPPVSTHTPLEAKRSDPKISAPASPSSSLEQVKNSLSRQSEQPAFAPAWHVPTFTWPRVCRHILRQAGDQVGVLADAVAEAANEGRTVFAIAGCRRGEGATTLLLCVARQLATRGAHVVVVDADHVEPSLAKRLGVQAQIGWDEARELCERAVVEATANNMAVAPLKFGSGEACPVAPEGSALDACLGRLRGHYDIVLVDAGPVNGAGLADRAASGAIDAVLLVHNDRITSTEELRDVERQLAAAGLCVLGVVQNCVTTQDNGLQKSAA